MLHNRRTIRNKSKQPQMLQVTKAYHIHAQQQHCNKPTRRRGAIEGKIMQQLLDLVAKQILKHLPTP